MAFHVTENEVIIIGKRFSVAICSSGLHILFLNKSKTILRIKTCLLYTSVSAHKRGSQVGYVNSPTETPNLEDQEL